MLSLPLLTLMSGWPGSGGLPMACSSSCSTLNPATYMGHACTAHGVGKVWARNQRSVGGWMGGWVGWGQGAHASETKWNR